MTTIVNNPGSGATTDDSVGTVFAMIILALIAILFFVYGLPAIRNAAQTEVNTPTRIDVNLPADQNPPPVNNNIIIPEQSLIPAPTMTPEAVATPQDEPTPTTNLMPEI